MTKLQKLRTILKNMDSVLVAFSGGLDSSFLLKVCKDTLGDRVLAVTAQSSTYPKEELIFSKKIAASLGARHKIIKTNELNDKRFAANPVRRCYFCKKILFERLKKMAAGKKIKFVIDASNVSDKSDFRPGKTAKRELKVRSPLEEAGFTKTEIRTLSRKMGLESWDKPALACLASRVPYGTPISRGLLKKINSGELLLRKLGFKQARLRHHGRLCRIEVPADEIPSVIKKKDFLVSKLRGMGYHYVSVDLEGYSTGSMNRGIKTWRRK